MDAAGTGNGGSTRSHGFTGGREISDPDEEPGRGVFHGRGGVPRGEGPGATGLYLGLGEGREWDRVWRGRGKNVADHSGVPRARRADGVRDDSYAICHGA